MGLRLVTVTREQANAWVEKHHRHRDPVASDKFRVGAWEHGRLVGVAICGNPVGRGLDKRRVVEVNRCCTDGTRNACTFLYGAAARAARNLGYFAITTYTLTSEQGASLRALGWWGEPADLRPKKRNWNTPARPRESKDTGPKMRWVCFLSEWTPVVELAPEESAQLSLIV